LEEIAGDAPRGRVEVLPGVDPADLPHIAARCAVALTNDSGMLHVAEACGVPVVAVFGPTHPRLGFAPLRQDSIALHTGISCSPCDLHGPQTCPRTHHRCLTEISEEMVLAEVEARMFRFHDGESISANRAEKRC
jgi:heptosyltransferase-2